MNSKMIELKQAPPLTDDGITAIIQEWIPGHDAMAILRRYLPDGLSHRQTLERLDAICQQAAKWREFVSLITLTDAIHRIEKTMSELERRVEYLEQLARDGRPE